MSTTSAAVLAKTGMSVFEDYTPLQIVSCDNFTTTYLVATHNLDRSVVNDSSGHMRTVMEHITTVARGQVEGTG